LQLTFISFFAANGAGAAANIHNMNMKMPVVAGIDGIKAAIFNAVLVFNAKKKP
jgi:hypothetical protein